MPSRHEHAPKRIRRARTAQYKFWKAVRNEKPGRALKWFDRTLSRVPDGERFVRNTLIRVSNKPEGRLAAIPAVERVTARTVSLNSELLMHEDENVRVAAVESLGRIASNTRRYDAIVELANASSDRSQKVTNAWFESVCGIFEPIADGKDTDVRDEIVKEAVAKTLDASPEERRNAVSDLALSARHSDWYRPGLGLVVNSAFHEKSPEVRRQALYEMGWHHDEPLAPFLAHAASHDPNRLNRAMAIRSLAGHNDDFAFHALTRAAAFEPDPAVRAYATGALAERMKALPNGPHSPVELHADQGTAHLRDVFTTAHHARRAPSYAEELITRLRQFTPHLEFKDGRVAESGKTLGMLFRTAISPAGATVFADSKVAQTIIQKAREGKRVAIAILRPKTKKA